MKYIVTTIACVIALFTSCSKPNVAGGIDQTDTGTSASLVSFAGVNVPNASVRVYKFRDSLGIWVDSTTTNADGEYTLRDLDEGRYSIWAETDSSALFSENLIISNDKSFDRTDTLKPTYNVSIPVKVQPNHDSRMVEAQILGTPIRHNVNAAGLLKLTNVPEGVYFTRLTTAIEGYVPTNDSIVITPAYSDTSKIHDTLELIYTGIPVVLGIRAEYDTLTGVASITWDSSSYLGNDGYLIYRDEINALELSKTPVGVTSDTHFADTIGSLFDDTTYSNYSKQIVYRVLIRSDDGGLKGNSYFKDTIDYLDPKMAMRLFAAPIDTVFGLHSVNFPFRTPGWIGEADSVQLQIEDTIIYGLGTDTSLQGIIPPVYGDSLQCIMKMTFTNGEVVRDTLYLTVIPKFYHSPVPFAYNDDIESIVSYRGELYATTTTKSNSMVTFWKTSGNHVWEEINSWELVENVSYEQVSTLAVWDDLLWIVSPDGYLMNSSDAVTWEKANTTSPINMSKLSLCEIQAKDDRLIIYNVYVETVKQSIVREFKNGEFSILMDFKSQAGTTNFFKIDNEFYTTLSFTTYSILKFTDGFNELKGVFSFTDHGISQTTNIVKYGNDCYTFDRINAQLLRFDLTNETIRSKYEFESFKSSSRSRFVVHNDILYYIKSAGLYSNSPGK